MIGNGRVILLENIPDNPALNTPFEIFEREGMRLNSTVHITGNNDSYNLNIFQVFGTVMILNQFAILTEINNITNMTGVYADIWDGLVSDLLTANGADLSGLPVGSWFTKDRESVEQYSVVSAATACKHEIRPAQDIGLPFQVTQKNGVDTFIRFNYTTNTLLDFYMEIFFKWRPINGGYIELVV